MHTLLRDMEWLFTAASSLNLDLSGLLALAPLDDVAHLTALNGTSTFLDPFVIVPGMHRQLLAPDLSKGEFPACAAMTTGYIFRVENEATVLFLQNAGRTGHLTTLTVRGQSPRLALGVHTIPHFIAAVLSIPTLDRLLSIKDWWAVSSIVFFMVARLINTICVRRRAEAGWFGQPEPGVQSVLLVLLSRDRWIRLEGSTDDMKAITSGNWLREPTFWEKAMCSASILLVYLAVLLVANASKSGQLMILTLLLSSAVLLSIANQQTSSLSMKGRVVEIKTPPVRYTRRLVLTKELITEFRRTDCFVGMGMIQPTQEEELKKSYKGTVVM